MHTLLRSAPAVPGRDEDAAGVLGDVAVLLDGAGLPQRFRAGCHHEVAWFSHTLAAHLLLRAQDPATELRDALADAVRAVRGLHADTCDLAAGSPSATVVAVRVGQERIEHLVLCDSSLLIGRRDGTVTRITDTRVDRVVEEEGDAEAVEARRNAPGGFWVARHEPEAAQEAIVGSVSLEEVRSLHLVSDGVTRAVDLLGLHDASSLVTALDRAPDAVLEEIRRAELALPATRRPRKVHDDATVLTFLL